MSNLLHYSTLFLDKNAMLIFYTCLTVMCIAFGTWYINVLLQKAIITAGKSHKIEETFIKAIQNIVCILVYIAGVILVLENLHIQMSAFFGALGFIAIGISLALQNLILNIASGMFLLIYKPFYIGDYIRSNSSSFGFEGKIIDINLRCTTLSYSDNEIVIIPN